MEKHADCYTSYSSKLCLLLKGFLSSADIHKIEKGQLVSLFGVILRPFRVLGKSLRLPDEVDSEYVGHKNKQDFARGQFPVTQADPETEICCKLTLFI